MTMANLPIEGFVTPASNYENLYRLGNDVDRKRQRGEQKREQAAERRFASDKYFTNYLDPKDRYTGTVADPIIAEKLSTALNQAYDLSSKGANDNEIFMAISPIVGQVNDYTAKTKQIQLQKKAALDIVGKQKGIDPIKFQKEFDDEVFMETDPNTGEKRMRDLSTIDPTTNYADKVLKDRDIYNSEGFDEYVGKSGKNTTVDDVAIYGKDKSLRRTKAEMTMPSFMVSDKDSRGAHIGFVPKYQVASDGEQVLMHKFLGDDGKEVEAPVRMVTDDVFNDLPASAKAYLRQEVKRFATQNNVPVNSAQAENFAKALAYDELKNSGKQYSTLKEMQIQKAAPAPVTRITVNNNGSSTAQTVINDIYKGIDDQINDDIERLSVSNTSGKKISTRVNALNTDAISLIVKMAKDAGYEEADVSNLFLSKRDDGRIVIYKTTEDGAPVIKKENEVGLLPRVGINLGKQANTKGKAAVVAQGNSTTPAPTVKTKGKLY